MNKKKKNDKEKVISLVRSRIDNAEGRNTLTEEKITDHELSVLLSELQIFQLELEMQNDELSASYQLLENERSRFAGFFNFAPVGYFILDHLGIVEEANQTGADLLCISKQHIINKRFQSFIDPEAWESFYAFLHKMQVTEGKQSIELKISLSNGTILYTRMEGIAIQSAFIDKLQYYITVIDVSESKTAQQKLQNTTQRLEMTLSASGTGTWTMEFRDNKVFLDEFSYSLLNISPWEFDGSIKGLISLIHPDDQKMVRQGLLNAVNKAKEVDLEFKINAKSGAIKIISAKGQQVKPQEGSSYFAGIIIDITEQKRQAQETQELENEKQKLILSTTLNAQEKERYKIANALHDSVCQILYGIRLNLQGINHLHGLKDEFKNVNQLLDQAIRETRELSYELTPSVLRDFGFSAGIKEMAQRLSTPQFKIKTNIKKSAELLNQEVQLYAFRIIQELINNCIKHAGASEARIIVDTENEWSELIVSDNGEGFNPAHSLSNGSGIRGIKNRVFLLNGNIDLKTSVNGTTVTIKFKNDLKLELYNFK